MSKEITQVLDQSQERFMAIAPTVSFDAERGFAMQLLQNSQALKKAAQDSPQSLQQAVVNIASIGLSLNPALKEAYLITRSVKTKDANNRDVWKNKIFLEPSYVGLCSLATSDKIEWIQAKTVHEKDIEFIDNGPGEKPTHRYDARLKLSDRGEFQAAYCVAKTIKGDYLTTVMDVDLIHGIRARSESFKKNFGPWKSDFLEMAKKTAVRNAFKMWPKSKDGRMAQAVDISNENEGFEPIMQASSPEIKGFNSEQKQYFDSLITESDALRMFAFKESLIGGDFSGKGAAMWTSLSKSFPNGEKGKYGILLDELCRKGQEIFDESLLNFKTLIDDEHLEAIKEFREDIDPDVFSLLENRLPGEDFEIYRRQKIAMEEAS